MRSDHRPDDDRLPGLLLCCRWVSEVSIGTGDASKEGKWLLEG
jgi:hypothetical protein